MIKSIKAKKILDSRGNPTIEVELETDDRKFISSVPSGASVGKYEAVEIRDEDKDVSRAIKNVNEVIGPKIKGLNPEKQKEIDNLMIELDGTKNKSKLGANAILGISVAVCRAGAAALGLPLYQYISKIFNSQSPIFNLPKPCFNIINGGAHARNNLDIQEFLIVPDKGSFLKNLVVGKEIYNNLKEILKKEFKQELAIGDEGGFSPSISKTKQALDFLVQAVGESKNTKIGLDCAASQFFRDERYYLENKELTREELLGFYQDLIKNYPIIFIEDPFAQEDWLAWKMSNVKCQMSNVLLIGDDLTVTNKERVEKAIKENCLNGIIVKPNQIGTITETLECVKIAKGAGMKLIVSHRSGETMDDFIADLAVGIGADFIKSGAPDPRERMAKYNRLAEIEKEIETG